jgi:Holliday junction resolvasome RuvABC endonuclease subunit
MIVMALDPSTVSTGWCIYDTDQEDFLEYGCIKPTPKDAINRIIVIDNKIKEMIRMWKPELVLIEDLSVTRNASSVKVLAGLQVVIQIACERSRIICVPVRPTQWRSVIGIKGKNRKEHKANAIQYVKEKYNEVVNEDEADAICIGEYAKILKVEEV